MLAQGLAHCSHSGDSVCFFFFCCCRIFGNYIDFTKQKYTVLSTDLQVEFVIYFQRVNKH